MRSVWVTAGVSALALSIAFGGAGAGASAPPSVPAGSGAPGVPVGEAVPIAPGVEVRPGETGTYASAAASTPAAVGDGVRTDATGFAEVAYSDGSRTRLDVNTDVEVVGVTDDAGTAAVGTRCELTTFCAVSRTSSSCRGSRPPAASAATPAPGRAYGMRR